MSIYESLISAGSALLGAYLGCKGAIAGAKTQIAEQKKIAQKEENDKIRLTVYATWFLIHEIESNMAKYINDDLIRLVLDNQKPFDYDLGILIFDFQEFNKIKYDMIKYSDEDKEISEVLHIYHSFLILQKHRNINTLTANEYSSVRLGLLDAYIKIMNFKLPSTVVKT